MKFTLLGCELCFNVWQSSHLPAAHCDSKWSLVIPNASIWLKTSQILPLVAMIPKVQDLVLSVGLGQVNGPPCIAISKTKWLNQFLNQK